MDRKAWFGITVAIIMVAAVLAACLPAHSDVSDAVATSDVPVTLSDSDASDFSFEDEQGLVYTPIFISGYSDGNYTYDDATSSNYSSATYARISGYTKGSTTQDLIFPSSVVYNGTYTYYVMGVMDDETYWKIAADKSDTTEYFTGTQAKVTSLKVYADTYGRTSTYDGETVSLNSYIITSDLFKNNATLTSLEFYSINEEQRFDFGSSAFDGCTSVSNLILPNHIGTIGITVFASMSFTTLTFDTSIDTFKNVSSMYGYMFSGCNNLKTLILGKNVNNLYNTLFSKRSDTGHSACANIEIVYNAGAKVTQDNVESSIEASGSSHVLIFNFCGGDLGNEATDISKSGSTASLTMPTGTITSSGSTSSIPSWTDKDGNVYSAGASVTGVDISDDFHTFYGNCTITFYDKDGNELAVQDVVCNLATNLDAEAEVYTSLPAGYTFDNWTDSSGNTYKDGQTVTLTKDLDLTASCHSDKVGIIYMKDNTRQSISDTDVDYGESITIDNTLGATYWSTGSDGSGSTYTPGTTVKLSEVITLYYQTGTTVTYTVNFNGNGSDGGSTSSVTYKIIKPSSGTKNTTVDLPENGFTRDGYEFVGWNSSADGSGTPLSDEITIQVKVSRNSTKYAPSWSTSFTTTTNVTIYAQWKYVAVTVDFDGNGADSGSVDTISTTVGEDVTIPSNSFVKAGKQFIGWSTDQNAAFPTYTDGQKIIGISESMTLYAVWGEITEVRLTVILNNTLMTYSGTSTSLDQGYTVVGLQGSDSATVSCHLVSDSSVTSVKEVGVYVFTADVTTAGTSGVTYVVTVYNGIFTILNTNSHSKVTV